MKLFMTKKKKKEDGQSTFIYENVSAREHGVLMFFIMLLNYFTVA